MDSQRRRRLAALLSTLLSQLIALLLLLITPNSPLSIPNFISNPSPISDQHDVVFPLLLLHHLSASQIAAAALTLSKKRKRPDPNPTRIRPDSFRRFFNMNSSTFEWLCGLLEPLLDCRDPIDSPLNLAAETRLGIGLFRLASGADFLEIAGQFRVSESVAKFCVKQLCRVLCTNFRFWVGFPTPNELESVSNRFETLSGLPNCCGVIQCVRFRIRRNREEEESIAAQIVTDSSSRILSIIAGFRGEKGDTQILKSSTLYKDIENGALLNSPPVLINGVAVPQFFAGEGAYPLLPWLMLPLPCTAPGSIEEKFNNAHRVMLTPALKSVASLRNWGVLNGTIEAEDKVAVSYIGACSILHNMLLMREDFSAFCDEQDEGSLQHRRTEENIGVEEMALASAIRGALATRAGEHQSRPQ